MNKETEQIKNRVDDIKDLKREITINFDLIMMMFSSYIVFSSIMNIITNYEIKQYLGIVVVIMSLYILTIIVCNKKRK